MNLAPRASRALRHGERMEQQALDEANAAHQRGAGSAGHHRAAMQGLSYQAQDAFTQISMGTNVLSVLAIQGGQAAGQMAGMGGKLGAIADFMMGPWGLAITAGMLVLGALTDAYLKNSAEIQDSVDKLKKSAAETENNRVARERFLQTVEGVAEAIRASTQASKDAAAEQRSAAERANIEAHANLRKMIAIRQATLATLEETKALMEANRARATRGGPQGEAAALSLAG